MAPSPIEVVLCTGSAIKGTSVDEPRQRVLHDGTAEFAELLNQLPDRNRWFRDWQRKQSFFWPDSPPAFGCLYAAAKYDFSFVLRYADGGVTSLIDNCTGWTDGVRTRLEYGDPSTVDQFVARFEAQT